MKTTFELTIRAFPVKIEDERTGEVQNDVIVLDKQRLQAAQMIGQSSTEIIERIYHRQGYRVLDIGKPDKVTLDLKLYNIYRDLPDQVKKSADQLWNVSGGDQN